MADDDALPFPSSVCHGCRFRHLVESSRGSRFLLCKEPSLPRYLPQPRQVCAQRDPGPQSPE